MGNSDHGGAGIDARVPFFAVLVSGWSDNGWLSGGHAVRMAMELCKRLLHARAVQQTVLTISIPLAMHKAWPELLKRMKAGKATTSAKDRQLVVSSRTWFCLYLFEHQYVRISPRSRKYYSH